jgi:hypothetical protein
MAGLLKLQHPFSVNSFIPVVGSIIKNAGVFTKRLTGPSAQLREELDVMLIPTTVQLT